MNGGTLLKTGACAVALVLLAAVPTAVGATPARTAQAAPAAPAKAGPLSPRLAVLSGEADVTTQERTPAPDQIDGLNEAPDGRLYVDVRVDDPTALSAADAIPGIAIEATTPDGLAATLAVPVGRLDALAAIDGVLAADEVPVPQVDRTHRALGGAPSTTAASTCPSGTTVSAGSNQLKVPTARSTFGVDGTGVKIGIISDSYGVDRTATANQVKAGDLPGTGNPCGHTTPVQIVADAGSGADEGRAMAQIVHDLAPGATLLFADAGASQIEMANHVRALRDAGAQVIVDDITYFDETMYQDGYLAAAVDEVVGEGITYLSSAGNMNLTVGGRSAGSYETQAFRPAPCPSTIGADFSCHDFDPGAGVTAKNVVTVPSRGSLVLDMSWNEAMYGVDTDLDVFLLDDATGEVLDAGAADSVRNGRPVEWAGFQNYANAARKVRIVVANYGKTGTPRFKVVLAASSLGSVQWSTPAGGDVMGPTLFGHAGSPSNIAVGAVTTAASPAVEPFSSRGPSTLCWEPSHGSEPSAAIPGCTTKTIDVLGTDGVSTTVTGFDPFYGTSAAAPHVAAVAALMVQHAPCATPGDIRAALQAGAVPNGSVDAAGSGRTDALAALDQLAACADEIGAPAPPAVTSVSPTSVRITITPPAVAEFPTYGYEAQLIRPGGEVVTTRSARGGGPYPSIPVDLPVEVGQAYRVRVRTDHIVAMSPWSPAFPSAAAFMNQLGSDFANRSITDDERQVYTFLLGDDWGPAYAVTVASSVEEWGPKIDPVIRLFFAYFLRKPDPSGLNYWLGKRRAGTTLNKISSTFAASSEFRRRYGALSNNAFVRLVYQNVLGRQGDAGGISYWTKQLDTRKKDRGQVMTGFSESSEYQRRRYGEYTTVDLFFGLLRRVPTNDELAQWTPVVAADVADGSSDGTLALARHLLSTPEYIDRVS